MSTSDHMFAYENHNQPQETPQLQEKKLSSNNLKRNDSLDIESGKLGGSGSHHHHHSKDGDWSLILKLAFQSIGVVYGDIGTSPLYVYASTFTDGIKHNDDILGVLSLIFYTITLIPLIKYIFIVLRANDNGDGGTFALYSLICRYAKVGLIPSQQAEDGDVSTFQLELPNNRTKRASRIKMKLENSQFARFFLLFATMLGTSMVIGDGVLTPCISVLSAVGGIKHAKIDLPEDAVVVWVAVAILVFIFMVQRFGTDKVGYCFAPIICIWFMFIAGIGFYNFIKFDPFVVKAINPKYIVDYFKRNKEQAWLSLGGVLLCITGAEALFADVGHFSVRSIQISMCTVTYPTLIFTYTGQASFLRKHNDLVEDTFYKSIPGHMYWPTFVVAVLASIIASQATISGTFSIIQQSLSLGCFPHVKIVHTSTQYEGQVYIPEVNYLLMAACVFVTKGFKSSTKLGNAYGMAVVFVMTLTSAFLALIMTMIWKTHIVLIIMYIMIIGSVELVYLSSVLHKLDQGGYLPLVFALLLMFVMFVWNYVRRKKYYFELDHKISSDRVKEIMMENNSYRLPGLAIFYSELVEGIPPIFNHYISNVPALHSVLVFVSINTLPISKVPVKERFLFRRVQPNDFHFYHCVVQYGYIDIRNEQESFENLLIERLKVFIRGDSMNLAQIVGREEKIGQVEDKGPIGGENVFGEVEDEGATTKENTGADVEIQEEVAAEEEILGREICIEEVDNAWSHGVVHFMGEHEIVAGKGAGFLKRIIIDYAYNLLKKNLRQSNQVFEIPQKRLLKVGMSYEL